MLRQFSSGGWRGQEGETALQARSMMWRLVTILAVTGLLAKTGPANAATKALVCCDFESGLQGWQKWSTVEMTQQVRSDQVHSGKGALWGEVTERGPLVHSLPGLDFSVASAWLSFWYFVPRDASFDWFEINLRTHEYGDRMFQMTRGLRKGSWTRMKMPFGEFFGWSFRAFGSLRVKQFEITSVGAGRIGLDDVEITADEAVAAAVMRVPSMLYLPGRDASAAPAGTWSYFRKHFTVQEPPSHAWLQLSGDDEARLWANGRELGKAGLSPATEFDLKPVLETGENVLAVAVLNHGQSPNPTGFAAVVGLGSARLDDTVLASDASWVCSSAAPDGWTTQDFDDHHWQRASVVCKVPGPPWGAIDIYPLRQPIDRLVPAVRAEARGRRILIAFEPTSHRPTHMDYIAHVNRLASDLASARIAEKRGRVVVEDSPVEVGLTSGEPLHGAVEVTVAFPGRKARVSKILWLPEQPVEQCERTAATHLDGTGFFRTANVKGRWFLVDPQGNLFHSLACNAIISAAYWSLAYHNYIGDHYANLTTWAEFACRRLFDLGFNSLSYGDEAIEPHRRRNMPYFAGVNVTWAGPRLQDEQGNTAFFPDVFDPRWQRGAEEWIRKEAEARRDDPLLIAYFTDNEIQMHQPLNTSLGIMGYFWSPSTTKELTRWLRERFKGDIETLNRRWSSSRHQYSYKSFDDLPQDKPASRGADDPVAKDLEDLVRHVIKTYADTVVGLFRKYDPNHLVCTNRFAGQFDLSFAELLEPYDLIACNSYPRSRWGQTRFDEEQLQWLQAMHRITGRPVIVTEWSVMAADTRLPNFWGRLDTQQQRAQAYRNVLRQFWEERYIVGSHWFSWVDSTDAEAINTGIVDAEDRFHQPLAEAMREENTRYNQRLRQWTPRADSGTRQKSSAPRRS